jgi:hypothetical protein
MKDRQEYNKNVYQIDLVKLLGIDTFLKAYYTSIRNHF